VLARTPSSVVAVTLVGVLAGCGQASAVRPAATAATAAGATTPAASTSPPPACAAAVAAADRAIARRIYRQAAAGRNVVAARRRLARSTALASAVLAGDKTRTLAVLRPLLRNQIHRIRITRGPHLLADFGRTRALAPVHGLIRDARGHAVGRYVLAVGTQVAVAGITHEVTGAAVTIGPPARVHAATWLPATAFPAGPLRIGLTVPATARAQCAPSPAATRAAVVRAVALRLFAAESHSPATRRVLRHVATDRRFVRAVAADDPVALRASIVRFFRQRTLHVVRIRAVTASGHLVNDVGGPDVIAPASRVVRDRAGRAVGRVTLSVQDDTGYIKLVHRFTGAAVALSTAAGPVAGSMRRPASATRALRFTVRAYPTGPLHVTLYLR
jgi:hypothetical protein